MIDVWVSLCCVISALYWASVTTVSIGIDVWDKSIGIEKCPLLSTCVYGLYPLSSKLICIVPYATLTSSSANAITSPSNTTSLVSPSCAIGYKVTLVGTFDA